MNRFPIHAGLTIAALGLLLAGARLVAPAIKGPETAQFKAIVDFAPDRVPLSPLSRRPEPEPVRVVSPTCLLRARHHRATPRRVPGNRLGQARHHKRSRPERVIVSTLP